MPDARPMVRWLARFDDDEIDADGEARHRRAAWQPIGQEATDSRAQVAPLATIEGLFRQAEVAPSSPADFDDHQAGRRARVDRHEVKLVATDMDVPGQDGPARFRQPRSDERLGGVTRELRRRSRPSVGSVLHPSMLSDRAHRSVGRRATATHPRLPACEPSVRLMRHHQPR